MIARLLYAAEALAVRHRGKKTGARILGMATVYLFWRVGPISKDPACWRAW